MRSIFRRQINQRWETMDGRAAAFFALGGANLMTGVPLFIESGQYFID
jgi:hypothetical protein